MFFRRGGGWGFGGGGYYVYVWVQMGGGAANYAFLSVIWFS